MVEPIDNNCISNVFTNQLKIVIYSNVSAWRLDDFFGRVSCLKKIKLRDQIKYEAFLGTGKGQDSDKTC